MPIAPNRSVLICITHSYPFGIGDDHFEDELTIISQYVDEVLLIPRANFKEKNRMLPSNTTHLEISFKLTRKRKIFALVNLNWKVLLDEIRFVKNVFHKKPSLSMLRLITGSLMISADLEQKLIPVIDEYQKKGYTIHLYSYWNDLSAVALALLKKKYPDVNTCSRAHAFEIYDERHAMNYIPFQQLKFSSLNHIFFISFFGLNYIQQRFSMLDFDRCTVSKLGCFEMPALPYKKDPDRIRIISIGYNYEIKRIDLIAKSILKVNGLKVKWMHVGDAVNDMEKYRNIVSKILSPCNSVEYQFAGNLSRQQLKQLYTSTTFDLLLNLSPLEGIPVSMMECMSAGIPVMATSVGGVPEIVKDGFNGILLPANPQPEDVASALQNFHSRSDEALMLFRRNARITWKQDHNAAVNYHAFAEQLIYNAP